VVLRILNGVARIMLLRPRPVLIESVRVTLRSPLYTQAPVVDVAPMGFPALAGVLLELHLMHRPYTFFALYVLEAQVTTVLDLLRRELEG
jgi:hypothetical protein